MTNIVEPREWLVDRLLENLLSVTTHSRLSKVLVVGGTPKEPELKIFEDLDIELNYIGVEPVGNSDNFQFLDLNKHAQISESYDLVICNQVLEHLYNLNQAFENLEKLVKPGGHLWITCPANNFRHGSPEFYCAGYSQEFLAFNLENIGFKSLDIGEISSRRVYYYRHLLNYWPSAREIRHPMLVIYGREKPMLQIARYNLKTVLIRFNILTSSRNLVLGGNYTLETFGFFKKI